MANPGFYKHDDSGEILYTPHVLSTPSGTYIVDQHATYTYPIDPNPDGSGGWWYFEDEETANSALSDVVPSSVTALQGSVALAKMPSPTNANQSFYAAIEDWVGQQDAITQLAWKRLTVFERKSPLINQVLGGVFGQTSAQIDEIFRQAELISL